MARSLRAWGFAAVLLPWCAAPTLSGLTLDGYSAAAHDLFALWTPTAGPFACNDSPSFVGAGYDWTGLFWNAANPLNGRALLTPRHSVASAHVSGVFSGSFLVGTGGARAWSQTPSTLDTGTGYLLAGEWDLAVGLLAPHVAPEWGVTTYPVLDLPTAGDYRERPVFLVGHGAYNPAKSPRVAPTLLGSPSIGIGTYPQSSVSTPVIGPSGVELQGGDSGGPALLPWVDPAGQPRLTAIGSHSAVNSTNNFHNFLGSTKAIDAMNAVMVGAGFPVHLVAPPATFWNGTGPDFGTPGAWTAGTPGAATYAGFDPAQASDREVSLAGASVDARGLVFTPSAPPESFRFSHGVLALGRGGIAHYGQAPLVLAADLSLVLADHQYWDARGGGAIQVAGALDLNGRLLVVQGTGPTEFSGTVAGAAAGSSLSKYGPGVLTLQTAATYAGPTWIYAGDLRLGAAGNLPPTTHLWLADNLSARLDLAGRSQTVARLNSVPGGDAPGRVDLGAAGQLVLEQADATGNSVFSGRFVGGTPGTESLVVRGPVAANTNTVRLAGASEHAGITRIEGTYFYLAHPQALGAAGPGNHTVVDYRQGLATPSFNVTANGTIAEDFELLATPSTTPFTTQILNFDATTLTLAGTLTLVRAATSSSQSITWDLRCTTNSQTVRLGPASGRLAPGAVAGGTNRLRLTSNCPDGLYLDGIIADGTIGGSGLALELRGPGVTRSTSAHTYTGVTWINATRFIADVSAPVSAPGAFGSASSAVALGSFNTNYPLGLYAADGVAIARAITVGNFNAGLDATLGAIAGADAVFSGPITLQRGAVLAAETGARVTFAGGFSGAHALTVRGPGTVRLVADSAHAGGVTVESGHLEIGNASGSATGSGPVTVKAGARLGGSGRLGGDVAVEPGGTLEFTLAASPTAQAPLTVAGRLDLGSTCALEIAAPIPPAAGTYLLATGAPLVGGLGVVSLPAGLPAIASVVGDELRLVVDPLAAWRLEYFGTAENAGVAADTHDAEGDGLPNLLEYALATSPWTANPGPLVTLAPEGPRLRISFLRARADLRYEVLASSDLVNWSVIATDPGTVDASTPVEVEDPVALDATVPRRFLRLRVTRP